MKVYWKDNGVDLEDDISFGSPMRSLLHNNQRPERIMVNVNELAEYLSDEMNVHNIRQYVRMLQLALRMRNLPL